MQTWVALMSNYVFSKLKLKRIDCAFTVQKGEQKLNFRLQALVVDIEPKHILPHGVQLLAHGRF